MKSDGRFKSASSGNLVGESYQEEMVSVASLELQSRQHRASRRSAKPNALPSTGTVEHRTNNTAEVGRPPISQGLHSLRGRFSQISNSNHARPPAQSDAPRPEKTARDAAGFDGKYSNEPARHLPSESATLRQLIQWTDFQDIDEPGNRTNAISNLTRVIDAAQQLTPSMRESLYEHIADKLLDLLSPTHGRTNHGPFESTAEQDCRRYFEDPSYRRFVIRSCKDPHNVRSSYNQIGSMSEKRAQVDRVISRLATATSRCTNDEMRRRFWTATFTDALANPAELQRSASIEFLSFSLARLQPASTRTTLLADMLMQCPPLPQASAIAVAHNLVSSMGASPQIQSTMSEFLHVQKILGEPPWERQQEVHRSMQRAVMQLPEIHPEKSLLMVVAGCDKLVDPRACELDYEIRLLNQAGNLPVNSRTRESVLELIIKTLYSFSREKYERVLAAVQLYERDLAFKKNDLVNTNFQ